MCECVFELLLFVAIVNYFEPGAGNSNVRKLNGRTSPNILVAALRCAILAAPAAALHQKQFRASPPCHCNPSLDGTNWTTWLDYVDIADTAYNATYNKYC